jgi:pilus assembly protein CpaB
MAVKRRLASSKKRLILAVGAGVAAALLMFLYAGNLEAQARAAQSATLEEYGGAQTTVLVASRDLLAGEEVSVDNAVMMPWLSDLLPQGAITNPDEAYGKTLSVPLWANEPLLASKLGVGEEPVRVPDDLSAVCIPISDDRAVGGSLSPGSSVDVYAIGSSQVRLVLADVLVLEASNGRGSGQAALDETDVTLSGSSRSALKWVTLAVSDEAIPELLSAARDSTLSLVLPGRNAGGALRQLNGLAYEDKAAPNESDETDTSLEEGSQNS